MAYYHHQSGPLEPLDQNLIEALIQDYLPESLPTTQHNIPTLTHQHTDTIAHAQHRTRTHLLIAQAVWAIPGSLIAIALGVYALGDLIAENWRWRRHRKTCNEHEHRIY